jgi:putative tryptophan/tyrosine transport system substrate-binding protein
MNRPRHHAPSRRRFLRGLVGVGVAAGSQPLLGCRRSASSNTLTARVYRIGFLSTGSDARGRGVIADGLIAALGALGYVEGRNLTIEWRFSEGLNDRTATYAAQLVQMPVDLIVAPAGLAIEAAMQATNRIPIVMAPGTDPVENGFVTSLARPSGNVTGVASLQRALAVKRLELLTQILPAMSRMDVLSNASRFSLGQVQVVETVAPAFGIETRRLLASNANELDAMFTAIATDSTDAIYAIDSPIANTNKDRILAWAARRRAPVIDGAPDWVTAGALLTYGSNAQELVERVTVTIDRILKGARPAEIPVEQPTRFDLVINLRTAQTLGLTIPTGLVAQASEVIR